MKIERINDSQMKFMLTKTDLDKRSLDISDLAYGSIKTQELFQDIIDTACKEFSFNMEDTPLMIDAVPTSKTSIMIILTKVSNPVTYQEAEGGFKKVNENSGFMPLAPKNISSNAEEKDLNKNKRILKNSSSRNMIFAFASLDEITNVSKRIKNMTLESSLYKYNDEYLLNITFGKEIGESIQYIENIISEYGDKLLGAEELKIAYLKEKGNMLIKKNAVSVMANL